MIPAGAETVRHFFSDSPSHEWLNGTPIDYNGSPHSSLRPTHVPGGPGQGPCRTGRGDWP
jgi:hypothetical protein